MKAFVKYLNTLICEISRQYFKGVLRLYLKKEKRVQTRYIRMYQMLFSSLDQNPDAVYLLSCYFVQQSSIFKYELIFYTCALLNIITRKLQLLRCQSTLNQTSTNTKLKVIQFPIADSLCKRFSRLIGFSETNSKSSNRSTLIVK